MGMISLHSNHLGFHGLTLRLVTVDLEFTRDWRVLDYIKKGRWDVEALSSIFWPINIVENLRIPLGHNWAQDCLVWHFNK